MMTCRTCNYSSTRVFIILFLGKFIFPVSTTNLVTVHKTALWKDFNESVNKRKTLELRPKDATRKMDAENHSKKMPKM